MVRLRCVALRRHQRDVLQCLGQLGASHLTQAAPDPESDLLPAIDRTTEIERCDQLLTRIAELRRRLAARDTAEQQLASTPSMPAPQPEPPAASQPAPRVESVEDELQALDAELGHFVARRETWQKQVVAWSGRRAETGRYLGAGIPADGLGHPEHLHVVIGTLPTAMLAGVAARIAHRAVMTTGAPTRPRQAVVIVTTPRRRRELEAVLDEAGFAPEALAGLEAAAPEALMADAAKGQASADAEGAAITAAWRTFLREASQRLATATDALRRERSLLLAEQLSPHTQAMFVLEGWVPADRQAEVAERIRAITQSRCVLEFGDASSADEDAIPILLESPRWLRPFQAIVEAFGLPRYRELAPTLFVALTYPVMFGIMFGDVGHGAVLLLAGMGALRWGRGPGPRDFGVVLAMAGITSMAVGLVYGSCFGLPTLRAIAIWHDPLEGDPMEIIRLALTVGAGMISLGVLVNVVNCLANRDYAGGILGKFGLAGLLGYWFALLLVAGWMPVGAAGMPPWLAGTFLGLALLSWIAAEPLRHGHRSRHPRARGAHATRSGGVMNGAITRLRLPTAGQALPPQGFLPILGESVASAFEAVLLYFANTVSFVRLAAYALSHAALLLATVTVAAEVRKLPSPVGEICAVLVMVAGNAVTLGLEAVVAAVQGLRLEYYELFGKFFSGAGIPFHPFQLEGTPGPTPPTSSLQPEVTS